MKVNKKINKYKSPWMTKCVLNSIKRKNKLYSKYLSDPNKINENLYKKYKTRIQKLTNIQKKIIRLMTFQSNFSHTEKIFIDLQILNLSKLNNYLTSLFMFRYHHLNNLPKFFTNFFISNNQIHQYNTRNSTKLHKSYQRTNYVKHSLSVKGVDVWNNLDSNLTIITSRPIFKKKSRIHFLCN
jgi:hypothetical protein